MSIRLVAEPAETVVLLRVAWPVYQTLVDALGDTSSQRLAYNGEVLEIMSPLPAHEEYVRLLDGLLLLYAYRKELELQNVGSFTMQWEPVAAEPDSSYYIANAAAVIGKRRIEFSVDPPPDLVLEVDISRARVDKQLIYRQMRIAEYWRYDGTDLRAYALSNEAYVEIQKSKVLDGLPISDIHKYMEMRYTVGQSAIRKLWIESLSLSTLVPSRVDDSNV